MATTTFSELRGQARPAEPALFDSSAVVRTFDTPEFQGVTFYEVEAKSLINRVPNAANLPFEWTINVYRGCSHACTYCAWGDTPILMADGRTRALADLRVGDEIYGTVQDGPYRRYVTTQVLAHWSTVKPAYRITLEDGTKLITSGDHRFLSNRGWKHVTGSEHGRARRPHLTVNNKLMGTGQFAEPPKHGADYRRGYLCGMIRGDGTLGSKTYRRSNGRPETAHWFRLALVDTEALQRTRSYLADFGVDTGEYVFQQATATRKLVVAIYTGKRHAVAAIHALIAWPDEPSDAWREGFLAGIFDAEGSYSRGILRICNTDRVLIEKVTSCLRRLGFSWTEEIQGHERIKPVICVRLLGGVREHLRLFHTVDPAITRKRTIVGQRIKNNASLRVVSIEPLGLDLPLFDITTGTGDFIADGVVSHNCFARPTHTFLGFDAGKDFESRVVVKINAAEVLRREVRKPSWRGEHISMGTNTDPYQRCEGRYRLTRSVLEVLAEARNPCSVLTKSPLLTRDLDVMAEINRTAGFAGALSIGTLDEEVWRRTEPGTPHPRARIEAVRALNEAGIPCGVLVAPVLPGISDRPEQLREVVTAAVDAGATHVTGITLHLRPGVKEEFLPWLDSNYPELSDTYRRMYRGSNAPRRVQNAISACIAAATVKAHGPAPAGPAHRETPNRSGHQAKKDKQAPQRRPPVANQLQLSF